MAINYGASSLASGSGTGPVDPVLEHLAKTNTFDEDWPALQNRFYVALSTAVPLFLALGPPRSASRPHSPPAPGPSSFSPQVSTSDRIPPDDKPPPESLLLSPSTPSVALANPATPNQPTLAEARSVDVEPPSSPHIDGDDLAASTRNGLVIPPFPPLDPSRRRRSASATSLSPEKSRANGAMRVEEDWEEDTLIGGRILPGFMGSGESEEEIKRVGKILSGLTYAPFTVQRIAELLVHPRAHHTSIGKFLRALEKALLVSTPWEAPSYEYIPAPLGGTARSAYRSNSSASSDAGSDEENMMPPGSSTPMFSPIPFLSHEAVMPLNADLTSDAPGRSLDDGLMSPLMLGGDSPNPNGAGFRFAPAPSVRSPTPEPDDVPEEAREVASGESDASHQSYLGRVDELDTGPIQSTPPQREGDNGDVRENEPMSLGAGEGGNMTPHGMSEKPVPISATTVVEEKERSIAALPKASLADRFVSAGDEASKAEEEGMKTP